MVTSSARELASIFSITRARCSLTVRIVIPNSLAISLLSRPKTTWFKTSCSRGVNVLNPSRISWTFTESFLILNISPGKSFPVPRRIGLSSPTVNIPTHLNGVCQAQTRRRHHVAGHLVGPEPHVRMSETGSARSALSRITGIKALSGVTPNAQSGDLKLVGNEFEAGNGETEASIG